MLLPILIFPILLLVGIYLGELRWVQAGVWLVVLLGILGVCALFLWSAAIFCVAVAAMDAALILMIFKGDIAIR